MDAVRLGDSDAVCEFEPVEAWLGDSVPVTDGVPVVLGDPEDVVDCDGVSLGLGP